MFKRKTVSDKDLVSSYLAGGERCLETLITRHQERIFNYIYTKVLDYDLANDLFQDSFIKIINSLKQGKYNEEGKFLPWALRITHNMIMDFFRAEKRMYKKRSTDEFDVFNFIASDELNIEDNLTDQEVIDKVIAMIEILPKDQKLIVYQRMYAQMSFKEIAEQNDISINTALGRMRYAILNLRKFINEKDLQLLRQ